MVSRKKVHLNRAIYYLAPKLNEGVVEAPAPPVAAGVVPLEAGGAGKPKALKGFAPAPLNKFPVAGVVEEGAPNTDLGAEVDPNTDPPFVEGAPVVADGFGKLKGAVVEGVEAAGVVAAAVDVPNVNEEAFGTVPTPANENLEVESFDDEPFVVAAGLEPKMLPLVPFAVAPNGLAVDVEPKALDPLPALPNPAKTLGLAESLPLSCVVEAAGVVLNEKGEEVEAVEAMAVGADVDDAGAVVPNAEVAGLEPKGEGVLGAAGANTEGVDAGVVPNPVVDPPVPKLNPLFPACVPGVAAVVVDLKENIFEPEAPVEGALPRGGALPRAPAKLDGVPAEAAGTSAGFEGPKLNPLGAVEAAGVGFAVVGGLANEKPVDGAAGAAAGVEAVDEVG